MRASLCALGLTTMGHLMLATGVSAQTDPLDAGIADGGVVDASEQTPPEPGSSETAQARSTQATDAGAFDASVQLDASAQGAAVADPTSVEIAPVDAGSPDASTAPDASLREDTSSVQEPQPDLVSQVPIGGDPGLWERLGDWVFDRQAEEEARRAQRLTQAESQPAAERETLRGLLGLDTEVRPIPTPLLVLFIATAFVLLFGLERVKPRLSERGLLPRLVGLLHLALRLSALLWGLILAARLLPGSLRPALTLTLAAMAIALGWGLWVLVPDIASGIVLLTERRVRPGVWIETKEFAGRVTLVGPRVTELRTERGTSFTVPNRVLMRQTITIHRHKWRTVSIQVRPPTDATAGIPAALIRCAIEDAVLMSPEVCQRPELTVEQVPSAPGTWAIRVRLLRGPLTATFRGALLERITETLHAPTGDAAPTDTFKRVSQSEP